MKLKLLIMVLFLQSAWIVYTVATQEHALASGPTVLLETQPVDPRDFLRGDYLTLNYKISSVPAKLFLPPTTNDIPDGQTVYVAIARQGEFHQTVRASTNQFEPTPDELVLQGKTRWSWRSGTNPYLVNVEYGIERYYVPEGTGNPHGTVTVNAVITSSHRAVIKQLLVDGKPFKETIKE